MYVVTITERTPMEPGNKDTNTYHLFCDTLLEVAEKIEQFDLNWGCLVSMTVTPFKE